MAMDHAELLAMGARIAELREESGLSQQQIADYCDVRLRAYQFWQAGKHPPQGENLQKLAEIFRSRGLDYVTERYILHGNAPDVLASMNGSGPDVLARLTTIEERLERLGERLEVGIRNQEKLLAGLGAGQEDYFTRVQEGIAGIASLLAAATAEPPGKPGRGQDRSTRRAA